MTLDYLIEMIDVILIALVIFALLAWIFYSIAGPPKDNKQIKSLKKKAAKSKKNSYWFRQMTQR